MNERIEELAREADFMLCEDGHFYSEGQSQKITNQLQKFAELIIKDQQRPWVGLTGEEIKEIWLTGIDRGDDWLDVQGIARAIEDALRRKNT